MAGVEQRPRVALRRDCWRRLRHWRRSVRSTGAGVRLDGVRRHDQRGRPCQRPEPNGPGQAGYEALPRHRRVRHAARLEAGGRQPVQRPADGAPSMPCRRAAGDHQPTVRRPRPARAMSPGCHKRVRLPSDLEVPRSCGQIAEPGSALCGGRARAVRGLGVGRNASTGRLRRVQPDWSLPATPDLLRHEKAARSHACQHLRRSVRRNRAARSVERSALAS